jgi:hypothetical protein
MAVPGDFGLLTVARTWRVRGRRREAPRRGTQASGGAAARCRPAPPRQPSAAFSRYARTGEVNAAAAAKDRPTGDTVASILAVCNGGRDGTQHESRFVGD